MQEEIIAAMAQGTSDHIPRQQALLKAFRDRNLPVIYVNVDFSKFPNGSVLEYGVLSKRAKSAMNPKMQVIPELAPQPGEPVLSNWIWGAFTNSGLEQELRARGVGTLVLFGCAFHVVVYNATVQAVDLWYPVIVPEDACVPTKKEITTPEMMKVREVFTNEMFPLLALVTTTNDVIAHLG